MLLRDSSMAADPDHVFTIPDNDFFGLGPAEFAGEVYQQGLIKAGAIEGLYSAPALAPGLAPAVALRAKSGRGPARRLPCTFRRADFRADGSPWPANVGQVQPWLICHVCGQQFSPASLLIHELQCLNKYNARKRKIDPTPRRPRVTVDPPMSVSEYNDKAYAAYNESANSKCPICGKTFGNDKIVKHQASCTDFVDQDPVAELMSQAVEDGISEADAVAEAMKQWRQSHPPPSAAADAERQRAAAADGGAAAVNELLFREWLDELRGYSESYRETEPGETLADAQQRHLVHVEYRSTVGEHLDGVAVKAALEKRHSVGGAAGKRQRVLQRRVKQIEQLEELVSRGVELSEIQEKKLEQAESIRKELSVLLRPTPAEKDWELRTVARPNPKKPWRPETAPLCVGGTAWSPQYYEPHEHGARTERPLATPSFSGVIRNTHIPPATAAAEASERSAAAADPAAAEAGGAAVRGDADQAVRIEDAYLEAKFPMRQEAKKAPPGDGRARTRARLAVVTAAAVDQGQDSSKGGPAFEVGVGACLVTKPLSRGLQLEAAFETVDTRATSGRMDARALQTLMAEAGLPVSEKAAQLMIDEANMDGDKRGLTVDEFVRMLKVA